MIQSYADHSIAGEIDQDYLLLPKLTSFYDFATEFLAISYHWR
jgi:hypothetical protein